MRQLIAALKNYGISKLHFTHYSNLLSYPKDEEVRYVIKSLLLCDQDIDLQVCWDIQNRHVKYFKELYSEVALSQEGAAEFTSVPNSKFSWKSYKFDSSSRAVDLDGQGIYAAIYNGRLPASSVGKDRRRFEGGILLDPGSIKIGRAKNLRLRFGAYARDFGEDNIQFYPLNNSEDLRGDEARLKSIFGGVRLYSNHGRLLEWISPMSRHQFRLRIEKYLSSFHD